MADDPSDPIASHLRQQLEHRYRVLERSLVAGMTLEHAVRTLGGRPSIAWHAVHLGDAIASTSAAVITGAASTAPLGAKAERPTDEAAWVRVRTQVLERAQGLLSALAEQPALALDEPPLVPILPAFQASLATRRAFLEGHVFHVTYHVGAIGVLRAEWGLDRGC